MKQESRTRDCHNFHVEQLRCACHILIVSTNTNLLSVSVSVSVSVLVHVVPVAVVRARVPVCPCARVPVCPCARVPVCLVSRSVGLSWSAGFLAWAECVQQSHVQFVDHNFEKFTKSFSTRVQDMCLHLSFSGMSVIFSMNPGFVAAKKNTKFVKFTLEVIFPSFLAVSTLKQLQHALLNFL